MDGVDQVLSVCRAGMALTGGLLSPGRATRLLDRLWAQPDPAERRRLLGTHAAEVDDDFMAALKEQVETLRSRDSDAALEVVALMHAAARVSERVEHRALALVAEGNVVGLSRGDHAAGKAALSAAAGLYRGLEQPVAEARAGIGLYWCLAKLGETEAAEAVLRHAYAVFGAHADWLLLGLLVANHGAALSRAGHDDAALLAYAEADTYYRRIGAQTEIQRAQNEQNIGFSRAVLGEFDAAIAAFEAAATRLGALGVEHTHVARVRMNLAVVHAMRGRINEALNEAEALLQVFAAAKDLPGLAWVQKSLVGWKLEMRRYGEAYQLCQAVRSLYQASGSHQEEGATWLVESEILAGIGRLAEADAACRAARSCFEAGNSPPYWGVLTDLRAASIALAAGRAEESLELASHALAAPSTSHHVVDRARACLVGAKAHMALGRAEEASALARTALDLADRSRLLWLVPAARHLLGLTAIARGDHRAALVHFHRAIRALETQNRSLMIEYRSQHLVDQPPVYAAAVSACLALGRTAKALKLADRAKSRALVDLLDHKIDLTVRARSPGDRHLVGDLLKMDRERNRLYRRWMAEVSQPGEMDQTAAQAYWERNAALQAEITSAWHRLLVANADYANDAVLWRVQSFAPQRLLDRNTALVEYFVAGETLLAFVATEDGIVVRQMAWDPDRLQNLEGWLQLNFDAVAEDGAASPALLAEATDLLHAMYTALFAPIAPVVAGYAHLIIVPHDLLHHLPFHAFHNGASHLIERHRVSRLPAASVLRHLATARPSGRGAAAIGHSFHGRLPNAPLEADAVAAIWGATAYTERAATLSRLRRVLKSADVVHLAAHMVWEPEAPLFSRMTLADGELTAFDVFNGPRIPARLVTLSGCNTAKGVVSGGDEVLGLTRALLQAGATSLIASQWPIEDAASAQFMTRLHGHLASGATTGQALQRTAMAHIHSGVRADDQHDARPYGPLDRQHRAAPHDLPDQGADPRFGHPCYWAPFMLIGRDQALV